MTSLPSKVPPSTNQPPPNDRSTATSIDPPAIKTTMDPNVTRRAGRITTSTNGNIDLEDKRSADPPDDYQSDDDSDASAPISTLSFPHNNNEKDAASKYCEMVKTEKNGNKNNHKHL